MADSRGDDDDGGSGGGGGGELVGNSREQQKSVLSAFWSHCLTVSLSVSTSVCSIPLYRVVSSRQWMMMMMMMMISLEINVMSGCCVGQKKL